MGSRYQFRQEEIEAISGNHYGGNHRNMSEKEEAKILEPFKVVTFTRTVRGKLATLLENRVSPLT